MEEDEILEKIKKYVTKEKKLAFLVTFITALIAHFSYYTQLVAITDTYANGSYYLPGEWEISIGRWGIYFFNKLRFGIVSPVIIASISFFILGIISILINDILKMKSKLSIVMISILIAVFPHTNNILLYTYTADTYFIAMLLSVLAVKLFISEKKINNIYGIICIIISLSIYQYFLSVTVTFMVVIFTLNFIKDEIDLKTFIKNFLNMVLNVVLALISYYIITKIILKIANINISGYFGIVDDFKYIFKNVFRAIYGTYIDWYRFYFSSDIINNSIWHINIINILVLTLLNINVFRIILKSNTNKFVKSLLWYIVFLMLPVIQNVIRLIVFSANIVQTTCTSYIIPTIMLIATLNYITYNKKIFNLKYLGIILILYLSYVYALSGEATYISLQKNYNQIHSQMIRVIDRIENNENYTEDKKIRFIGGRDFRIDLPIYEFAELNKRVGFFGWSPMHESYLREEFGIRNEFATDEEMEEIYETNEYKEMKEFPDKTSVKVINDIIVVKLEPYSRK